MQMAAMQKTIEALQQVAPSLASPYIHRPRCLNARMRVVAQENTALQLSAKVDEGEPAE
jgi:hypothetical protein